MKLDVLPHSQVSCAPCVLLGHSGNSSELVGLQQAIRNSDSHHEVRQSFAFAIPPADDAGSVALGVHAPPAEIRAQPLRRDRTESLAREPADLVEALRRVLLALQPFDSLRIRFRACT